MFLESLESVDGKIKVQGGKSSDNRVGGFQLFWQKLTENHFKDPSGGNERK